MATDGDPVGHGPVWTGPATRVPGSGANLFTYDVGSETLFLTGSGNSAVTIEIQTALENFSGIESAGETGAFAAPVPISQEDSDIGLGKAAFTQSFLNLSDAAKDAILDWAASDTSFQDRANIYAGDIGHGDPNDRLTGDNTSTTIGEIVGELGESLFRPMEKGTYSAPGVPIPGAAGGDLPLASSPFMVNGYGINGTLPTPKKATSYGLLSDGRIITPDNVLGLPTGPVGRQEVSVLTPIVMNSKPKTLIAWILDWLNTEAIAQAGPGPGGGGPGPGTVAPPGPTGGGSGSGSGTKPKPQKPSGGGGGGGGGFGKCDFGGVVGISIPLGKPAPGKKKKCTFFIGIFGGNGGGPPPNPWPGGGTEWPWGPPMK